MSDDVTRLPDLLLERYALGELSEAERSRVETVLSSDPAARARLDELEASSDDILDRYPGAEIAASIKRRMLTSSEGSAGRRSAPGARFSRGLGLSAAAVALVLVGAVVARSFLWAPSQDDMLRAKGGAPGLMIYKKTAGDPQLLADGDRAAKGDVLQIRYAAGAARYGVIVSIDGRGSITWHLPPSATSAMPSMPSSRESPRLEESGAFLGSAYELDDAPDFERFFIVSSGEAFDPAKVGAALRVLQLSGKASSGSLSLVAGLSWRSLILYKNGGPQ
jgi:Predicted transmembrane transcriptional regulator (anti-sigma factor)